MVLGGNLQKRGDHFLVVADQMPDVVGDLDVGWEER